jgi:hypothetical protein
MLKTTLGVPIVSNKYFKNAKRWDESSLNFIGLPRPFALPQRKDLAKRVPIPWQSEDRFEEVGHLRLNVENEFIVYQNSLCSYCGVKINDSEIVIRWFTANLNTIHGISSTVYSDIHPLHMECMKQARIFCPHMRKLEDKDFETGPYFKLKENAILQKNNAMIIKERLLNNE